LTVPGNCANTVLCPRQCPWAGIEPATNRLGRWLLHPLGYGGNVRSPSAVYRRPPIIGAGRNGQRTSVAVVFDGRGWR
jgi:hypothetical protein